MYLDSVVISGLIIVVLTCVVFGYALWFFIQHIRREEAQQKKGAESGTARNE